MLPSSASLRTLCLAACCTLGATLLTPLDAAAFCGFYVSNTEQPLYNSATQVVMMRQGTRTVLSMRNSYKGPAKDFAMVVPVPVVLQEFQVKTLSDTTFERLNAFTAPRLVEYYEKNPCEQRVKRSVRFDAVPSMAMADESAAPEPQVMVEAEFKVGEYEVVILSAKESTALETWLLENKYNIPSGASEVLQSYISQGQYFFVAKVDASKVKFDADGNAVLSPLRFHYDSEDFQLPVRLGLLNARGYQDLIVHILSPEGRYEVANYENAFIPTNRIVEPLVKDRFSDFYEALFTRAHAASPGTVITEYAWGGADTQQQQWTLPVKCDPCTEPPGQDWSQDLLSLGAELLSPPPLTAGSPAISRADVAITTLEATRQSAPQPPDETDEPAPERVATPYDLSYVQGVMLEQREPLERCYEQRSQYPSTLPPVFDLEVLIRADGTTASVRASGEQAQLIDQITQCAGLAALSYPAPERGEVTAKIRLQFDRVSFDARWLDLSFWTVTRMHARYTAKELEQDLVFRKGKPVLGGRGTPSGKDPSLPTDAQPSSQNNFQARYIVLHPYTDWHVCLSPQPGNWLGQPAQAAAGSMSAKRSDTSAPIDLASVVKKPRGFAKKRKVRK